MSADGKGLPEEDSMRGDDAQGSDSTDRLARIALSEITPELAAAYLDMVDEFEAAGEGYGWNDVDLA